MARPLLRLFGVKGDNAFVDLGDELDATFRWARLRTPVSNIESWRIEGPGCGSRRPAIGVRMSIRHRDLSFAGTPRGGVRIDFREPFACSGAMPGALRDHRVEGFAAALSARGIPGLDARKK